MPMLHEAAYRSGIEARLRALKPDAERRFGKMSVSQMLWHVNEAMEVALGIKKAPKERTPLPGPIMKFLVINVPWPKGAPTILMFVAKSEHDFEAGAKDLGSPWPENPVFGSVRGRDMHVFTPSISIIT